MALPTIDPYPLPAPGELPANRADWPLEPDRAVLLVHDMQRYFLSPYRSDAEPLSRVRANIADLCRACRDAGVPVVYTAKPGGMTPRQRGLESDFWGAGMEAVAEHTDIDPALAPAGDDVLLTKWRYSAFAQTDLAERMAARGRDQVVVTGVYAHIGCQLTAADAFMRDIRPFLVADAVADFSADHHRSALLYAAGRCARVLPTADALAELGATAARTGA
ncbi:bifunctional isochorismate lyase / aryl carrier protein [Nocardiopsis flavescens]|uniref:Bifunctional isochorismate lyase / aryl carrier protein n=1 Tax=Nocardiopsis flavescens TaxID=758803 RepID=A0A1M6J724_9ACTN|nr:isochorismatase family protein [Nocardiopsis flavescens]SHJ42481.1 bifunctional isochorismate lyase / aryl carrier protein [Nocardiopsis flavescens]